MDGVQYMAEKHACYIMAIRYCLTICPENESCGRAVNFALRDAVHHDTSVVTHIRGLHFGNVKVSCLLGDETPIVLLNKVWVLIKNPCISEVWKTNKGDDDYGFYPKANKNLVRNTT